MKILVLNGPNINMLGERNESKYGEINFEELNNMIRSYSKENRIDLELYQSNHEGDIIDKLHSTYFKNDIQGLIVNLGAYSHYSIAIRDALEILEIPIIEVHISNVYARERFRHKSIIAPLCIGQITGLGVYGYILAIKKIEEINNFN